MHESILIANFYGASKAYTNVERSLGGIQMIIPRTTKLTFSNYIRIYQNSFK